MSIDSNSPLVKNLVDFGLSEKEARVYVALLELEIGSVNEVAKKAEVNRSTAYVILESLVKKGMAGIANNDKVQRFVAASPDMFLRMAEQSAHKEDEKLKRIKEMVPELKALHKDTGGKPKVRIFEGKEGLKNAIMESFETKEKVNRAFSSGENILKILPDFLQIWADTAVKLGIELHGIYVDNKAARDVIAMRSRLYKIVFVPQEHYPSPVDMMIADDKVGYLIVEKNRILTIIIESKEIGAMMRGMFDLAFEEAKKRGGKLEERP